MSGRVGDPGHAFAPQPGLTAWPVDLHPERTGSDAGGRLPVVGPKPCPPESNDPTTGHRSGVKHMHRLTHPGRPDSVGTSGSRATTARPPTPRPCSTRSGSYTHPHLTRLSQAQIDSEISRTKQTIANAGGGTPKLFRPPYGESNSTVQSVASGHGLTQIIWNVDT